MALKIRMAVAVTTLALSLSSLAKTPENFIYTSSGDLDAAFPLVARSDIGGVQIVYNWRLLEPEKDSYDFSRIEQDLARVKAAGKNSLFKSRIVSLSRTPATCRTISCATHNTVAGLRRSSITPAKASRSVQDGWRVSGILPCASATRHCWPPSRNALMARCMG